MKLKAPPNLPAYNPRMASANSSSIQSRSPHPCRILRQGGDFDFRRVELSGTVILRESEGPMQPASTEKVFRHENESNSNRSPPNLPAYNPRMASANPPFSPPPIPGFWFPRICLRGVIKQGNQRPDSPEPSLMPSTRDFTLHQGYWAVLPRWSRTKANLGAAWKAALYRTIGSTCGAIAAGMLIPILGDGPVGAGIVLFVWVSLLT